MTIRAAILGPTGYSGRELIRILLHHPGAEVIHLGARREGNPAIAEIWPGLRGLTDLRCGLMDVHAVPDDTDVVFAALPHGLAFQYAPALRERGMKVIDLSGDYRLGDAETYAQWYGLEHTDPHGLQEAAYGLTEFYREDVADATLVANPGCYPTAVLLAATPLARAGLLAPNAPVIADCKSGVTGAGRKPGDVTHYPECNECMAAYKVAGHRHTPEMRRFLEDLAGQRIGLHFTPHLAPMDVGILATCYLQLREPGDTVALTNLFADFYRDAFFVRTHGAGTLPRTKDVAGTNFCDVAVRADGRMAIVVSVIDNLVKGAAGQAVQNMNVMFGLDEKAGLL